MRRGAPAIFTTITMVAVLTACGGYTEDDLREQVAAASFGDGVADCVVDGVIEAEGSAEKFGDLSESKQKAALATAGASCAAGGTPGDSGDLQDLLDLRQQVVRQPIIDGMVQSGLTEEQAECVLDEAVDKGYTVSDLTDADKGEELRAACA